MRILVTNDDGIGADGILALERTAEKLAGGPHEVWVVAPMRDCSGTSHSLTFSDALRLQKHGPRHYALSGTPGDCTAFALVYLMKDNPPDLVLSGINHGWNVAEDVLYSGTVGAAVEASIHGIDAIALSYSYRYLGEPPYGFEDVEAHAPKVLNQLLATRGDKPLFLNINFPAAKAGDVKGVRVTDQGLRGQDLVKIEHRLDPHERDYFWYGFHSYGKESVPGSDLEAVRAGYISVTPLRLEMTDHARKSELSAALQSFELDHA